MKIQIKHILNEDFIICMIALFLSSDTGKKTKADFIQYLRCQVEAYGSCHDSQFGENFENDYDDEILLANSYYDKWFL